MNYYMVTVIVLGSLGFIAAFFMSRRNDQVYKLLSRVLDEESCWISQKLSEGWLILSSGPDPYFKRLHSLPSYDTMWLMFWIPVSRFEEALKPFEYYYPTASKLSARTAL